MFGGDEGGLKIGMPMPLSGPQAALGESFINGFELRLEDQMGGEINGTEVNIESRDTAGDPAEGSSVFRELLISEEADIMYGPVSSAVVGASLPTFQENPGEALWFAASTASGSLEACLDRYFHAPMGESQAAGPMGEYAANNLGDTAFTAYLDYAFGNRTRQHFADEFEANGGEVVGSAASPFGTSDYATFVDQIAGTDAELVWGTFAGTDSINFLRDFNDFGLSENKTIVGAVSTLSEDILGEIGDAAVGNWVLAPYSRQLDNDLNDEFKTDFEEKAGRLPDAYACWGNDIARSVEVAVTEAGTDIDEMVNVLEGRTFDTVSGEMSYREENHNSVIDIYACEVAAGDDVPELEVKETFEGVEGLDFGC
jgi:branched-chain amino acid transport system substrate-binding protein